MRFCTIAKPLSAGYIIKNLHQGVVNVQLTYLRW